MTNVHYSIRVFGVVHGVGYRIWVKERAEQLGLSGTVKNCYDGSVCIEVEGVEDSLKQFIEKCNDGPIGAVVHGVDVQKKDGVGYCGFQIESSGK